VEKRIGWACRRVSLTLTGRYRRIAEVVRSTVKRSSRERLTTSAASLAFHWLLAIFPTAIALLGIAHLLGLTASQLRSLTHGLSVVLPAAAANIVTAALKQPISRSASVIEVLAGAVVGIWSGVEAMASMQVGLDTALGVERDRGFVGRRVMALPLLGMTVVLGGAAFALMVLGGPIGSLIHRDIPLGHDFNLLWTLIRWVGSLILISLLIAGYYSIGPNVRRRIRWVTTGSICATLAWVGGSVIFEYYLDHFGHESRTYGSFAGIAVLMLWLLLTALAVLIGATLDKSMDEVGAGRIPLPARTVAEAGGAAGEGVARAGEAGGAAGAGATRASEAGGVSGSGVEPSGGIGTNSASQAIASKGDRS